MNILKKSSFSFYILLIFLICQAGFTTQMVMSISNLEDLLQQNKRLERNFNVTAYLENINNVMQDAELGFYRYALSKNRDLLEEIKQTEGWLVAELGELDQFLSKTEVPGISRKALHTVSDHEIQHVLDVIAANEHARVDPPFHAIDAKQNVENRGKLRDLVSNMAAKQSALMNEKEDGLNEVYRSTIVTYIVFSVICSLSLLLFYRMYTHVLLKSSVNKRNVTDLHGESSRSGQPELLSRRLLAMSEQEKASLARELHDELGSNLMILRMNLANALDNCGESDPALATQLRETLQVLKKTVDIKRRIIENLRPSMLENFGLATSLRACCEEIAMRSGLKIDISINGNFNQLDADRSIAIYRIVQESLTNAVKYAKAKCVSISLNQFKYGVRLHISDDGVGIAPEALKNPKSHGILGMRERAVLNGGNFNIYSSKAAPGTRIDAFIPCVDL